MSVLILTDYAIPLNGLANGYLGVDAVLGVTYERNHFVSRAELGGAKRVERWKGQSDERAEQGRLEAGLKQT